MSDFLYGFITFRHIYAIGFPKFCRLGFRYIYKPNLMYIVNMTFRDEIFSLLDDDSLTLVFPTENASRYWLSSYARERGCSILASRAIAFDLFR